LRWNNNQNCNLLQRRTSKPLNTEFISTNILKTDCCAFLFVTYHTKLSLLGVLYQVVHKFVENFNFSFLKFNCIKRG
jgi:hypothetical protein